MRGRLLTGWSTRGNGASCTPGAGTIPGVAKLVRTHVWGCGVGVLLLRVRGDSGLAGTAGGGVEVWPGSVPRHTPRLEAPRGLRAARGVRGQGRFREGLSGKRLPHLGRRTQTGPAAGWRPSPPHPGRACGSVGPASLRPAGSGRPGRPLALPCPPPPAGPAPPRAPGGPCTSRELPGAGGEAGPAAGQAGAAPGPGRSGAGAERARGAGRKMANVGLQFQASAGDADPQSRPLLLLGQLHHLHRVPWSHVRGKLQPRVTEEVSGPRRPPRAAPPRPPGPRPPARAPRPPEAPAVAPAAERSGRRPGGRPGRARGPRC